MEPPGLTIHLRLKPYMPTGLGTSYWVWLWQQPSWRRWLCICCGLLVSLFSGKSVATVLSLLRDVHHSFHDALVGEFKTYSACVGLLETRLFSQKKKNARQRRLSSAFLLSSFAFTDQPFDSAEKTEGRYEERRFPTIGENEIQEKKKKRTDRCLRSKRSVSALSSLLVTGCRCTNNY